MRRVGLERRAGGSGPWVFMGSGGGCGRVEERGDGWVQVGCDYKFERTSLPPSVSVSHSAQLLHSSPRPAADSLWVTFLRGLRRSCLCLVASG